MIKVQKEFGKSLAVKTFTFPGGEVGTSVKSTDYAYFSVNSPHLITARITCSNDLVELLMVTDAIRRIDNKNPIYLFIPYIPYARQDRVCNKGEALSLKVFADLINQQKYERVYVCDPHSDVSSALIDNVRVFTQLAVINKFLEFVNENIGSELISPDAGSNKKISETAKFLNKTSFTRADKLRDLQTGNIKETIVYCDDFRGANVCIIDDICDGGRTFIELAKVCRAKNCGKISLFVTHGIFSKGVDELLNNGIDTIWTTDSFKELVPSDKLKVFGVQKLLLDALA